MSKTLSAALLAIALTIVSGCGEKDRVASRPGSRDEGNESNPNVLVREAVASRTALSSIAGKGVMRIVDQPGKFGLTVNADVIADDNDRLRIRADKLAGTIQAFDVVMLGDDIGFYIPTQKTLFHGKVEDLEGFSFRFDPDDVLRQMLRPDETLAARKWRFSDAPPAKGEGIVLDEVVRGDRPRLRVALNPKNGSLASVTQLDADGRPVLVKRYGDYRGLENGRRAVEGDGSIFPYLISFTWPRDRRSMEMHFKSVEGNAPVADEDFDIAASSDTQYRPLREARMEPELERDEPLAARPREQTRAESM